MPPDGGLGAFLPARVHATTANALDGYDVVEVLGVVRGITVRSRSLVGTLGAVFQQSVQPRGGGAAEG